jgi:hypothetical protein
VGEPQVKGFFVRETNGAVNPGPGAFTELSASGTLTAESLLDISGSSSGQIKFPATQNASANANTLDDYEEGTYTPTWGAISSLGDGTVTGRYTKIGRMVHVNATLVVGSTTTFAVASNGISLPFSLSTVPAFAAVGNVNALDSGTNFRSGICYTASSTQIGFLHDTGGGDWSNTNPFTIANGDQFGAYAVYNV